MTNNRKQCISFEELHHLIEAVNNSNIDGKNKMRAASILGNMFLNAQSTLKQTTELDFTVTFEAGNTLTEDDYADE